MSEQSIKEVICDALFFCFHWINTKEGPQYWYDVREAAIDEIDRILRTKRT